MPQWSPTQYLKFADERTRPARELLARVSVTSPRLVYDLGCGPGNSTTLLTEAFPGAEVIGIDNSEDMIAKARASVSGAHFEKADLNVWQPDRSPGLIFSNATFQWLPRHLDVMKTMIACLPPGGVLAVQMPDNLNEPSHVLMREVAACGPWAAKLSLAAAARTELPGALAYYDALKPSASRMDIWHTICNHALDGAAGIVEWVKGTGLLPYLAPLSEDERRAFLADYQTRIAAAYPAAHDGKVLLRFPRLFIVVEK